MSERYVKLFSLPENLYANGSPVVIAAGALLKDNQTGKVIVQLKMRNVGQKPIKAARVSIQPLDTVGNPLGERIAYQYLDLNAARDQDFGQKAPVVLADAASRSFTASVEEIIFADNTLWSAAGEAWETLPGPVSLNSLGDAELVKQFRTTYGNTSRNLPLPHKDLWYCACGELNRQDEAECHRCRQSLALLVQIDMDKLRAEKDARVAAETEQAEKEAAAAQAKATKTAKIAAVVIPILVVAIVAAILISGMVKKSNTYNDALALMDAGQYAAAIEAFEALGDYKDSAEQVQIAEQAEIEVALEAERSERYYYAISLLSKGSSEEAYAILTELGDYKNSASMLADFKYVLKEMRAGSEGFTYYYDSYGRLLFKIAQNGTQYSNVYENERLVKEGTNGREIEYTYNEDGSLASTKYGVSVVTSIGKATCYVTTKCNADGYPISIENKHTNNLWKYQYNYAEDGTLETIEIAWHKIERNGYIAAEPDGTIVIDMSKYVCFDLQHSPDLACPQFWAISEDGTETTVYGLSVVDSEIVLEELSYTKVDSMGNPIEVRSKNALGQKNTLTYTNTYDENGNLVQVVERNEMVSIENTYEYTYGYIYCPDAE